MVLHNLSAESIESLPAYLQEHYSTEERYNL